MFVVTFSTQFHVSEFYFSTRSLAIFLPKILQQITRWKGLRHQPTRAHHPEQRTMRPRSWPHIFSGTTFSEVHYLSSQPPSQAPQSYQPYQSTSSGNNSSWTSYGNTYSTNAPQAPPQPHESQSSAPLLSSLSSVTIITPALIHQVNSAASSNPTLANLLQLAAAGKASPDQLQTLGLLIQSLAHSPAVMSQNAIPPPSYPPAPAKEFDLVFEFQETSSETVDTTKRSGTLRKKD